MLPCLAPLTTCAPGVGPASGRWWCASGTRPASGRALEQSADGTEAYIRADWAQGVKPSSPNLRRRSARGPVRRCLTSSTRTVTERRPHLSPRSIDPSAVSSASTYYNNKEPLGEMQSLESLDLSRNKLSGEIPVSRSNLTFLSYLDLSYYCLIGRIPSGP